MYFEVDIKLCICMHQFSLISLAIQSTNLKFKYKSKFPKVLTENACDIHKFYNHLKRIPIIIIL